MRNNYKTIYRVERYNDNAFRVIKLYRSSKKNCNNVYNDVIYEYDTSSSDEISLSRSKRNIRRIGLSNNFEFFATWTVDSKLCDRYSLTAIVEKMKTLCKAFQRKYKNFKYIYVIEKHEDGAFHFHGLIKGVPLEDFIQFKIGDKMSKKIADKVKKGAIIYHIPFFDEKLGFNTFTKIKNYNKCCNYILKYVTKDTVRTLEGRVYFCSRGLSKGESYEVKYIPHELFESTSTFNYQDLCSIRDLYFDSITKNDLLAFGDIKNLGSFLSRLLAYLVSSDLNVKKY